MKIRGILIDPIEKSITEVELEDTKLSTLYEALGCDAFDIVYLNSHQDVMYVDDNGLFTKTDYFSIDGFPTPVAGRGLVLGTSSEGETIGARIETVSSIEEKVTFISPERAIQLAERYDTEMQERTKDNPSWIFFPIADMIRDRVYTDQSE